MRLDPTFIGGLAAGLALVPILVFLFRRLTVEVEDGEAVVVTRFGRYLEKLERPGLHAYAARLLPWVDLHHVSLRRDFRLLESIHVNDARGTTVMVDLWIELRIVDPVKALFAVADWDRALRALITHAATSILSNREFRAILRDRDELGELLRHDLAEETARWGLELELTLLSQVAVIPEVSHQMLESVSAQLERAKAAIEEDGRLRVAELEAETSVDVAERVAEAKACYPRAIGQALSALGEKPRVLAAYNDLYDLNQVRPHRTVAFRGFGDELRSVEAAMLLAPQPQATPTGAPQVQATHGQGRVAAHPAVHTIEDPLGVV